MARHYFYVEPVDDHWEVCDREPCSRAPGLLFESQDAAIEGAIRLARTTWRTSDEPTGVRVPCGLGEWRDARTFGREARVEG